MSPKPKQTVMLARASIHQDGEIVRGKIPVPVVKALRAKEGDALIFEQRSDGTVVVRKATAAERKVRAKSGTKKQGSRK